MQTRGYYFVNGQIENIYRTASLREIVEQLERCDYRCEAGPLRLNLAFQELKRRAEEQERTDSLTTDCGKKAEFMLFDPAQPLEPIYSCGKHLGEMMVDGWIVTTGDLPTVECCCYIGNVQISGGHVPVSLKRGAVSWRSTTPKETK